MHPAYDTPSDGFAPPAVHGNPKARQEWAVQQLKWAAAAAKNLGLKAHATFSGALAWPFLYPFPQRPAGLVEEAFDELARRWTPILDEFDQNGVDLCYEIHPGEDLHDGVTLRDVPRAGEQPSARQPALRSEPLRAAASTIWITSTSTTSASGCSTSRTRSSIRPARQGVYGGFQSWVNRAGASARSATGRSISPRIFSKLAQYDFDGWAVLEWECALKHPEQGAREGAQFIAAHIIRVTENAFDDFAASGTDKAANRKILGLS